MDKKQENFEDLNREIHEHEIYEHDLEKNHPNATFAPCRNCKTQIRKKMRRCPYCGILNPTVTIKEIMITMVGILVVMFILALFMK